MTKAEKFKAHVEKHGHGSPVEVSSLVDPYKHLCDRFLTFYRDWLVSLNNPRFASFPAGEIYLGITWQESVNAVAFPEGNDEFIGIYLGTIRLYLDDFLALFASPRFLPEIGDSTSEQLPDGELKEYLGRDVSRAHFQIMPKGMVRLECAKLFAWLVWKRIFMHEVGHIVLGHLESPPQHQMATLTESERKNLSDDEFRRRQVLEAHADMYSAGILAEFWNGYFESQSEQIPQLRAEPFKYFGVITSWDFRRKDSGQEPSADILRRTHPRPDIRFHHFWLCFFEKLQSKGHASDDAFVNQFVAGDSNVTELWKNLGFPAPHFDQEKDNFALITREVERLREGISQMENAGLAQARETRAKRIRESLSPPPVKAA